MALPWLPKKLMDDVDSWGIATTVSSTMQSLKQQAAPLFEPLEDLLPKMPEPPALRMPEVKFPEVKIPEVPTFDLGKPEDWMPWASEQRGNAAVTPESGRFELPSEEAFLGPSAPARPAGGRPQPMPQGQPSGTVTIDRSSPTAFLGSFVGPAAEALAAKGYPTSLAPILAAIPMNEQGWQQEAPGNNYYGIKGSNPRTGATTGPVGTWEDYGGGRQNIKDTFRAYDSPTESVADFLGFLESNPRYADAIKIGKETGDPAKFIRAIHAAGYATDPAWSDKILSIAGRVPAVTQRAAESRSASGETGGLDVNSIVGSYKGVPYVFGGGGGRSTFAPGAPTDCSGFVAAVWKNQYGLDLAAHTDASYNQLRQLGAPEVSQQDARAGDVVYYMGAGTGGAIAHHMGIYAGDGKVLDMSTAGAGGVGVRDVGHGGRFVILRDPRVSTAPARTAEVPPPIVPTGLAEASGGTKPKQAEIDAASEGGGPLLMRTPLGDRTEDVRAENAVPAPPPLDPDLGPREATPGSVGAQPAVYDPRTADEAATARELPIQRPAVPQAPVGGHDDPGTQALPVPPPPAPSAYVPPPAVAPPTIDGRVIPPPGSPYAPDVMGEAPATRFTIPEPTMTQRVGSAIAAAPGRFYEDVGAPIVERLAPRTSLPEAARMIADDEIRTAPPRDEAGRGFEESIRTAGQAIIRPVEDAIRGALERAGIDPAAAYQAAQDASSVLGPAGTMTGMVRSGAGELGEEAARAARRARIAARGALPELPGGDLPSAALPIRATPAAEVSRMRLDLFPPDVRPDIQAAAEGADYARLQRRGVLSDTAVQTLATEDERSVDQLIRGGTMGQAYNPEETVGIRNAVASQANVVRELSDQIAQASTSGATPDLLIARRAAEATKLQALVQVAEGARAEAGRTLRQYAQQARLIELNPNEAVARIRAKIADPDEYAKIVDEYTQAINDGADPIIMAKLWAKVERGEIKAGDIFALYRRFNMLSGPRTLEVNALSGALNLGYEMLGQAGTQVARGRAGEAAAELGAPFKAAGRAFQNMAETMWHGVSAEQAARGDIPRNLSGRTDNPAAKAALTAMEIPDRLNSGVDQFFRTLTEDWAATILAHKQARAAGVTPRSPDWAETVAQKLEAIREDVTAFPEIKAMADRVTFSEEPGKIIKKIEELKQTSPNLVGVAIPFVRTPANIASRAVDISPIGPVRTAVEAATGMGRGRENLSTRVRDNVIGTAASYWAYTKAEAGELTGMGPDDPEKQAELRATGWQPYSIKIGDQYWSYANFAPFSLALSAGAAASEAKRYAKPGKEDTVSMLADGAMRTGKVVTDMTVLAGLGAVIKAQQDPDRYGTQWLSTALTQVIPAGSLVNTLGQATDPLVRRSERTDVATQVTQNLQARVPGLRETVPPAQDPRGRPIESEQTGWRALNPFRPTTERDEPMIRAFLDANVDLGKPPAALSVKGLRDPDTKPALTATEQRRGLELRGQALDELVGPVLGTHDYQQATPAERAKWLEKQRTAAGDYAHRTLGQEIGDDEIDRRATELANKKAAR